MAVAILEEFKKEHSVPRCVYWNDKAGMFCARSYSAILTASKINAVFTDFKNQR
jgi:hypothetical protein